MGDNELTQESSHSHDYVQPSEHSGPYLLGPMVIRVYPDGRPVPADAQRPLPRDEDIEDIRYNARLPSIKELEEPPREMLPPARQRVGPPRPGLRLYARLGRPNNLLLRERLY